MADIAAESTLGFQGLCHNRKWGGVRCTMTIRTNKPSTCKFFIVCCVFQLTTTHPWVTIFQLHLPPREISLRILHEFQNLKGKRKGSLSKTHPIWSGFWKLPPVQS
eukprot:EG_transcript_22890